MISDFNFSNAVNITDAVSFALFDRIRFDCTGRTVKLDGGAALEDAIAHELSHAFDPPKAHILAREVVLSLEEMRRVLISDAEFIYERDPAATSCDEVIFTYPGFYAIFCHRLAHIFYCNSAFSVARFISEYAHSMTGADIHPGAVIGESFSIDHATGIVIGETSVIGRGVAIYHGVTIGAKLIPAPIEERAAGMKRHPTVEDGCTVYSCACILGKDTVIGRNSVIGAGVRITASVPENSLIFK